MLQQYFLYFCPRNFERQVLIEHLLVEGIIQAMSSMKAKLDQGHIILKCVLTKPEGLRARGDEKNGVANDERKLSMLY